MDAKSLQKPHRGICVRTGLRWEQFNMQWKETEAGRHTFHSWKVSEGMCMTARKGCFWSTRERSLRSLPAPGLDIEARTSPLPSPSPASASAALQLLPISAPLCPLLSEGPHCSVLLLVDTG